MCTKLGSPTTGPTGLAMHGRPRIGFSKVAEHVEIAAIVVVVAIMVITAVIMEVMAVIMEVTAVILEVVEIMEVVAIVEVIGKTMTHKIHIYHIYVEHRLPLFSLCRVIRYDMIFI
jgi:hypothetical protein